MRAKVGQVRWGPDWFFKMVIQLRPAAVQHKRRQAAAMQGRLVRRFMSTVSSLVSGLFAGVDDQVRPEVAGVWPTELCAVERPERCIIFFFLFLFSHAQR